MTPIQKLHAGKFTIVAPGTITLLRHANAMASNGKDADRRISDKGKRQCAAIKERFSGQEFDAILRSPLLRVSDTLAELGVDINATEAIDALVIRAGEESRQSGVIDTAYEMLGNVGLAEIFKYSEVAQAMDQFAATALSLFDGPRLLTKFNVLIAGHAWLCPILGYYLAGNNEMARRHILYHGMGECEVFQVGVDTKGNPIWNHFPCPAV